MVANPGPWLRVWGSVGRSRLVDRMLEADPDVGAVVAVWRSASVRASTAANYLWWVMQFRLDCARRGCVVEDELRLDAVLDFARRLARRKRRSARGAARSARSALGAWRWALEELGRSIPAWETTPVAHASGSPIVDEFIEDRRLRRQLAPTTLAGDRYRAEQFLEFLDRRGVALESVSVKDVDAHILGLCERLAPKTVASACTTTRALLHFLHRTGRVASDLGALVVAPATRRRDRPPRALPWHDVERILAAVDRSSDIGRRDYALLLLMAGYGLGAAEALHLRLEDIDWRAGTLHITRPKTGTCVELPLLPAVGCAVAAYLRRGRSPHAAGRTVFVQAHRPFAALSGASAVSHVIRKHAKLAGVTAPSLCSHVLRHSHATRQVEIGAHPSVVGEILGHRDPESLSAYVTVAFARLRPVSLPVPR